MADPLTFLARGRRVHGNIFVIRDAAPIFSRASDCSGAIAVFGAENQRAVLGDIESFGMPASAGQHLNLSQKLINLNRSLHSMRGDQHSIQKRLLTRVLSSSHFEDHHRRVWEGLEDFAKDWTTGNTMRLLGEMRELMLRISSRVLFGEEHVGKSQLALLLQTYFHLRREASSPSNSAGQWSRKQLLAVGKSLDAALRRYVRGCRHTGSISSSGILATLANLEQEPTMQLSEDEVVGHTNILFISSTEPTAVALTWILLILSQLPALRNELRSELSESLGTTPLPAACQPHRLGLLDRVINESLRLLPPNALMVRITTRPTQLGGIRLPARCEVVLCPFLAHRDCKRFHRPEEFLPDRWKEAPPSAFDYFPFGAGGHSCVGRTLALYLIKTVLAFLLPRYDLVLAHDQDIDWRVHIQFIPSCDPEIFIQRLGAPIQRRPGRLGGPIGKLLNLNQSGGVLTF
jgi:cytochrome P450